MIGVIKGILGAQTIAHTIKMVTFFKKQQS